MCNTPLHKILISLKQKCQDIKFLDQILTQTITSVHTHATATWNCLVRAYTTSPTPLKAILVYTYFTKNGSIIPDSYTYPSIFKACSLLFLVTFGKQVHAHVNKTGLDSDIYVQNAIVHFYGSVSYLDDARAMFDEMPNRDVASWNSLMGVYNTRSQSPIEVMVLFKRLMYECIRADKITLAILLSACAQAQMVGFEYGRAVHGYVIKLGFESILNVNNALLDVYTTCKQMGAASRLFDEMGCGRDVVSYTILIKSYVEMGLIDSARDVFDQIVDKDIVLWNLMVHAYVKAKCPNEALELFKQMENEHLVADEHTMVSVIAACASLSDLQSGRLVHQFINRNNNIRQDVFVRTALIDMYSKCGSLEEALVTFYKMEYRDVFTWTAMIEGLASNGYGGEALVMFNQMKKQGIRPNEATFLSGLKACSYSGLVNEGCKLFKRMVVAYELLPKIEHFCCLIDILSRAGLLHQAEEFIKLLPPEERVIAYKTLLSSCINYSKFDLGLRVTNEIANLGCQSYETHILLSNFYAVAGQWTPVTNTRSVVREFSLRKEPGISSVELKS